jgi:hypothetical protein
VRRRLSVFIAGLGMLASMPGGVLAGHPGTATQLAVSATVAHGYASLERITAPDELGFARPAGVAWAAGEGRLFVFDGARPGHGVAISTAGRVARAVAGDAASGTLRGAAATLARASLGATLRGLAVHPKTGHRFVYEPAARTLWELDASGAPVSRRDLTGFGLDDVRAMVVAPTADTTDAAGRMAVYVADAGRIEGGAPVGGGVYEIALSAPQRAVGILAVGDVTLVRTINTGAGSSNWSPDSPDPSGLAYNSATDRLVLVDGEVEETTGAGWNNVNGWFATRSGTSTGTFNTTTLAPANKEPVGAAYDPARNELYVVKDGGSSNVWVYNASTMNVVRSFSVAGGPYNNLDAEGVGFGNGNLYMVDAVDNDLVKVQPGANGIVGSGGDDVVNNYDLQQYGQDEPEGLDVDPSSGNIWVVSNKLGGGGVPQPMLEVTPNGALVSSVSIAAADPDSPGGLAIAPPSDGGSGFNIYIADRGVDNQENPNENDGKIFEFEPGGDPPPPPPPGEKMTNRGFELDANGDTRPDNWTTNTAFTRSSAVVHGDSFSGRHASTANVAYNVYQTATGITAGQSYAFSGWLNVPTTSDAFTFQIQLKWRGSGGAIRTDTIFTRTTSTSGSWVQMNANATAPAGATSVRVTMKLKSLNATIYVDDFSLVG